MNKLINLEKIRAAWSIGWATRVFHEINGTVMGFGINSIYIRYDEGMIREIGLEDKYGIAYLNELEITGYLYAGQLAGNEPILHDQKFKVRETGKIVEFSKIATKDEKNGSLKFYTYPHFDNKVFVNYTKEEIEPVFE